MGRTRDCLQTPCAQRQRCSCSICPGGASAFRRLQLPSRLALRALAGVKQVEVWGYTPTAFSTAGKVDVVRTYPDQGHGSLAVMAPPADTRLVDYPLKSGRWLVVGDTDAVVLNHVALVGVLGSRRGEVLLRIATNARSPRLETDATPENKIPVPNPAE